MSTNTITLNNTTPTTVSVDISSFPPHVPLDLTSLVRIIMGLGAQAAAPSSPVEGDVYLDDGTNTVSGEAGFRWYHSSAWVDLSATGPISSTPTSGQYRIADIRLDASLALVVEYDTTPAA